MIDLYSCQTPNGLTSSIMLEECELPWRLFAIDIVKGQNLRPDFLAINPNGKIPALIDRSEGAGEARIFESGAILLYLAEKTGRFLPSSGAARARALSWLFWSSASAAPTLAEAWHYLRVAPRRIAPAIERSKAESARLFTLLDNELSKNSWLSGEDYGIADISCYPWIRTGLHFLQQETRGALPDLPHVQRWLDAIGAREAVRRGLSVPEMAA
ncbi:MAG: glutathione S-transferase family protein [Rhodothalassiaceae bacterium]